MAQLGQRVASRSAFGCEFQGCKDSAMVGVVTAVDGMGCEVTSVCEHHADVLIDNIKEQLADDECEHCGGHNNVRDCRDPEEGNNGPVYTLCGNCRAKMNTGYNDDD